MNKLAIILIHIYQKYISPILPSSCRFYPSCSEYSKQAFETYGFFFALYLSLKRILKCNPMTKGYFDPLPLDKQSNRR
ncbi:MAG: membrane protein insertion efficiency factor YidD [Leptospiraceae bacterium]|nr:membrane protein insertion efficiency factor YidD [Leptospiraceae bacterium]MCP5497696.1 membrane protein insertion efficiency factor YidD [Leptospiraceae bacterium]